MLRRWRSALLTCNTAGVFSQPKESGEDRDDDRDDDVGVHDDDDAGSS